MRLQLTFPRSLARFGARRRSLQLPRCTATLRKGARARIERLTDGFPCSRRRRSTRPTGPLPHAASLRSRHRRRRADFHHFSNQSELSSSSASFRFSLTPFPQSSLNPYWNEAFDVTVKDGSVITVQVFDQKKFKKKDQGFLGVINVPVSSALDLDLGGDGQYSNRLTRLDH